MKYKIKSGYLLKEVADSYLVVAVGARTKEFNGVVKLNSSGAFLWQILAKGATEDQLVTAFMTEYDVDEAIAREDVIYTIKKLKEAGLAE